MAARRASALITLTVAAATLTIATPGAFAEGKSTLGCSSPYVLATNSEIHAFSEGLVPEFYTDESLDALLTSLDHNGDGSLCYKLPNGWTNGDKRTGFVNLVDDKILAS